MSGITGIGSYSYDSNYSSYAKISSGKKRNTAADGAAELSIVEKLKAQDGGYNAGVGNMTMAKSALNISDAALSGVTDYLQNIRELALRASNTVSVSASDREDIQQQIDQYKQGISQIAGETQFNTQKLLDGSHDSFELATDANGSQYTISGSNATLEALGIADFDVTGSYDLKAIDDAIEKVNSQRSKAGAQSNGLDYALNYNANVSWNTTSSISKMEDTEFGKAVSELKKNQLLQTIQYQMQKRKEENDARNVINIFA